MVVVVVSVASGGTGVVSGIRLLDGCRLVAAILEARRVAVARCRVEVAAATTAGLHTVRFRMRGEERRAGEAGDESSTVFSVSFVCFGTSSALCFLGLLMVVVILLLLFGGPFVGETGE